MIPTLWIVIPCYNEMGVLVKTYPIFNEKLDCLIEKGKITGDSKICYINDGSNDDTWAEILMLSKNENVEGISLSRNEGHQNALLAGLMSKKALDALSKYKEVNVFLRGMVPLVGFSSSSVYYERDERIFGQSHYPLSKMIHLAIEGITGLSIKPLRIASGLGFIFSIVGFVGVIWAIVTEMLGKTVTGWASMACIVCFMGGIQLLCLGIMGEYIGKIYLETKERPRYIIDKKTYDDSESE